MSYKLDIIGARCSVTSSWGQRAGQRKEGGRIAACAYGDAGGFQLLVLWSDNTLTQHSYSELVIVADDGSPYR